MKIRNILIIFILLFGISGKVHALEEATVIDLSKQSYADLTPGTYVLTSSGEITNRSIGFVNNADGDVFNIIIRDLNMSTPMWSSALNFYNSRGNMTVNIIIDGENSITSYGDNWSPMTFLYTKHSNNTTVNFGTINGGKLNLIATNGSSHNKGAIGTSEYDLDLDYPIFDSHTLNFGIVKYSKLNSIDFSSFEASNDITSLNTLGMQDPNLSINIECNYQIDIADILNGSVEYSVLDGVVKVLPKADKGFELDKLIVTGSNGNIEVTDNTFVLPDDGIANISAIFKPIVYHFIDGENATYQDTDLVFTLDGEYDLVDKVLINGNELDSSNYTITEGSTILTLKDEYLKTLDTGTYELTVTYTNGSSDTTTFTINENEEITIPVEEEQDSTTDTVDNPKTFDEIPFYAGLGLVSIVGLICTGIYFKKIC